MLSGMKMVIHSHRMSIGGGYIDGTLPSNICLERSVFVLGRNTSQSH